MEGMEVLPEPVAGIDVHRKSLSVCVRHIAADRRVHQEVRTFGTMTRDLLELRDWLETEGVTQVAMESTGVLWKPVYNLLEGHLTVLLVNARHVKQVEGHKTDVKDCPWLAPLLSCGLLKASFIPPKPQRELRDLTRRQLRGKIPQLRLALEGTVSDHHRFLWKMHLRQYDEIETWIGQLTERIEQVCVPFAPALAQITEVPGYNERAAQDLVAEIGTDMSRFASDDPLCSWSTICPGHHQSAGKQTRGKTVQGNRWLKAVLCPSAWAAARTKNSYFGAQYHRLAGRRGKKRAVIAVAHSQLQVIYHLLRSGQSYQDLGPDYFLKLNADRAARYHRKVLESMGYTVIPPDAQQVA